MIQVSEIITNLSIDTFTYHYFLEQYKVLSKELTTLNNGYLIGKSTQMNYSSTIFKHELKNQTFSF